MGWEDDSGAPNTLMSNCKQVSCWRDKSSLGCLLEKRAVSSGLVINKQILNSVQNPKNVLLMQLC